MSYPLGDSMHAFAAAGAAFLLAVLWFDLMFDVQVRKHVGSTLPPEVLAQFPADGASQHDHYLYGTPKRAE